MSEGKSTRIQVTRDETASSTAANDSLEPIAYAPAQLSVGGHGKDQ